MLNLKHTTRGNPNVPAPGTIKRSARAIVRTAAMPEAESERQGVSVLARVGQCAGAVAVAAMLAMSNPDASEAAKSGGRTGGSNFSRSRTERAAAPSQAAPAPQVNNYYAAPAPSPFGFSPFGFSPFGFSPFGMGMGPTVVVAGGGGIGLFSILFDILLLGVVFTAITSIFSAFQNRGNDKKRDDDGW